MKYSTPLSLTAILVLLLFVGYAPAQMGELPSMDSNSNNGRKDVYFAIEKNNAGKIDILQQMANHYQIITLQFGNLEDHFQQMMQIDNMSKLKVEMEKHNDLLDQMHDKMLRHRNLCQNMILMENNQNKTRPAMDRHNDDLGPMDEGL